MSIIKAMAAPYRQEVTDHAGRVPTGRKAPQSDNSLLMEELQPILDEGSVAAATEHLLTEADERRGRRRSKTTLSTDPLTYDKQVESPFSGRDDLSHGGGVTDVLIEEEALPKPARLKADPRAGLSDMSRMDEFLGLLADDMEEDLNEEQLDEVLGIALAVGAGLVGVGAGAVKLAAKKGTPGYIRDLSPETAVRVHGLMHKRLIKLQTLLVRDLRKGGYTDQLTKIDERIALKQKELEAAKDKGRDLFAAWKKGKQLAAQISDIARLKRTPLRKLWKQVMGTPAASNSANARLATVLKAHLELPDAEAKRKIAEHVGYAGIENELSVLQDTRAAVASRLGAVPASSPFEGQGAGRHVVRARRAGGLLNKLIGASASWKGKFVADSKTWRGGKKQKKAALAAFDEFEVFRRDTKTVLTDLRAHVTTGAKQFIDEALDSLEELYEVLEDAKRLALWSSWRTLGLGGLPNRYRKFVKKWFGKELAQSRREQAELEQRASGQSTDAPATQRRSRSRRSRAVEPEAEAPMDVEAELERLVGQARQRRQRS